jgi:lipid-A-disaccharide synthase
VDAVAHFKENYTESKEQFITRHHLQPQKPIIALLAGSRRQEIKDNLPQMLEAASTFTDTHQLVLAGAPGIEPEYYANYINNHPVKIVFGETYPLLSHSHVALVTSGTATLETALFRVPQVVCYYIAMGKAVSFLRRHLLKVPYISLVNLVANRGVVKELVAHLMTVDNVRAELSDLLRDTPERAAMLNGYDECLRILGPAGASEKAAHLMLKKLKEGKG